MGCNVTCRLLCKLLSINVLVIGMVMLVVWLALDYLAADYFMVLMKQYNISPTAAHQMFLAAGHRALIWASLGALTLAGILSFLLTRKVLHPLAQMGESTRRIAAGDYTARVLTPSNDEVGLVARAFNQMAENLQRVEHLRKTMVLDVTHELRTPLTNMRGYLEALRDGVVSPSKETFELLHEETLRLVRLVEDLLQLARADASKGTLSLRMIDLQELATQVLDLFRPQFATKGIVVDVQLPSADGLIMGDPEKVAQVFRNLLQNTWQYTPPGGTVGISAERLLNGIRVTFTNTGGEIAEEDLPFIFERFYRGEKSRSRELGGAGLGLAIVKELVEAHGGHVGADCTPSETRIWFTLPV
jgi:two-component system, OmpR family, sensor histidine kinase BaeS